MKMKLIVNGEEVEADIVAVTTQNHARSLQRPMNSAEIHICVINNYQEIKVTLVANDTVSLFNGVVKTTKRKKK